MTQNTKKLEKNSQISEGSKLAELFLESIDTCTNYTQAFSERVLTSPRYLQQEAFYLFLACIQKWAEQNHDNPQCEYTRKASEIMLNACKQNGLW